MRLTALQLEGFKSIATHPGQAIALGDVTVLLGANGAGKSNLISFFRMLGAMNSGTLQHFVGRHGVRQLLFYGPKVTDTIRFSITLEDEATQATYAVKLAHGLPDRLFVDEETVTCWTRDGALQSSFALEVGGAESSLGHDARDISQRIAGWLGKIQAFQFHDTSETARIKDRCYIDDVAALRGDAGNLAAFLRNLQQTERFHPYYRRIVRHVQKVMPQLEDFALDTLPGSENYVRLNWRDKQRTDYLFGPDQISDGSLRFMAMATLLLQPPELLPRVIVLDEPELGLHPAAILELAGMIKRATTHAQVVLATQSTRLVDEFSPDAIIVVERDAQTGASHFRHLESSRLTGWLERLAGDHAGNGLDLKAAEE
jgi:predicted ATPase